MQTKQDNSIRKAAVFVQNLDREAAETLYARLSHEEASRLRDAVLELGNIHDNEHEEMFEELRYEHSLRKEDLGSTAVSSSIIDDRDGVALEIGSAAYHAPLRSKPSAPELPDEPADWFACLVEADPTGIAGYLASEQPRAIALVLSYVTPDLAASILSEFPEEQQTKILLQLANLGEADPTSVRVLATGLSTWIKRQQQEVRVRENRLSSVKAIVAATPKSQRESLVSNLKEADHSIANDIADDTDDGIIKGIEEPEIKEEPLAILTQEPEFQSNNEAAYPRLHQPAAQTVDQAIPRPSRPKPLLSFADLDRIDERTLSQAITLLMPRQALLALVEASDTVLKRIESKLSKRSTHELRQRLMRLGPTSLAEIDLAKNEFILAAEQLVRRRRAASLSNTKTK